MKWTVYQLRYKDYISQTHPIYFSC